MAEKKVFMDGDNKAFFICPRCDKAQRQDVAAYRRHKRPVRISFTCGHCGNTASMVLERRSHYRIEIRESGAYGLAPDRPEGAIIVLDLSRTGVRVELDRDMGFKAGDRFHIEFRLPGDDIIRKEVIVVNSADRTVRAEFIKPLDLPPGAVV